MNTELVARRVEHAMNEIRSVNGKVVSAPVTAFLVSAISEQCGGTTPADARLLDRLGTAMSPRARNLTAKQRALQRALDELEHAGKPRHTKNCLEICGKLRAALEPANMA